jgi:hypothetical protein
MLVRICIIAVIILAAVLLVYEIYFRFLVKICCLFSSYYLCRTEVLFIRSAHYQLYKTTELPDFFPGYIGGLP